MARQIIQNRKDLLFQLAVACELEQGLCLQYLFTAFSLKEGFSEGGIHTQEQLNFVRMWKANIFLVGAQEMLHLTQAANLSAAAGGAVQLRRPNFPQPDGYYPTHLPWRLDPFSPDVIRRYVCYERPDPWTNPPFTCGNTLPRAEKDEIAEKDPFRHLVGLTRLAHQRPHQTDAPTIGDLYAAIRQAFLELPNVIIGAPSAQVDGTMIDFPQVIRVESRDDAARGIDLIIEQGEGAPQDRIDSHYGVFLNIYKQYMALKEQDPAFDPVRPVASNPLSTLHVDNTFPGWRLIDDPFTRAVNDLNSDIYTTMLLMLYRFFATPEIDRGARRLLSGTFLRIMTGIIKPLGEAITRLPMGELTPGKNAGPSYEINRAIQLLPHASSANTYLYERLSEDAAEAEALAIDPRNTQREVQTALRNVSRTLTQLAQSFADALPGAR